MQATVAGATVADQDSPALLAIVECLKLPASLVVKGQQECGSLASITCGKSLSRKKILPEKGVPVGRCMRGIGGIFNARPVLKNEHGVRGDHL